MRVSLLLILSLSLLLGGCKSKKNSVPPVVAPQWIMERPLSSTDYYGIGIAKIYGPSEVYKNKARQNALSDIASQINSKISSVSVLQQVEDKKRVSEIMQNRIESQSNEFLEGYTLVGTYTDETNYYECYKLSKQEFALLKEKRKTEAMNSALNLLYEAEAIPAKGATMKRVLAYVKILEHLSSYLNDNTLITSKDGEVNLNKVALEKIQAMVSNLAIKNYKDEITTTQGGYITEKELSFTIETDGALEPQIPVKFELSGNYLRKDKCLTNDSGIAATEVQKFQTLKKSELFTVSIDNEMISRIATKNIAIRMLIMSKLTSKNKSVTISIP